MMPALVLLLAASLPVPMSSHAPQVAVPTVVALVVGNNAGDAELPTLSYADDDAVRMAGLLRATGATVELLTRADLDTARQLDTEVNGLPTMAALSSSVRRLAAVVERATTATAATTLIVYFAGHGDAEQGTGSLLLEDGRVGYDALRAVIDEVKASTTHVLLDACNAFFVVHARGASGRSWATPSTAGAALSSTVSDVGVFVSTSAEAQVFEWSQLQGGIFSHVLRSGLRGAADADVDGEITYAELEAFVRLASEGIVNAAYVPQLFARAPQHTSTVLDVRAVPRRPLPVEHRGRLSVRDAQGTVLLDVHPEPGFQPSVVLPAGPLLLEGVDVEGVHWEQLLDDESPASVAPGGTARGPATVLQRLFAQPYGPTSLRDFAQRPPRVEVFGVSSAQEQRLRLYLRTLRDDAERNRTAARFGSAAFSATTALGFAGAGAVFAAQGQRSPAVASVVGAAGFAAFAGVLATGWLNPMGDAERAATTLLQTPPQPQDAPGVRAAHVANTIDTITAAADSTSSTQTAVAVTGWVTAGVTTALGALALGCPSCVDNRNPEQARAVGSFMLFAAGLSASVSTMAVLLPTDASRLEALMRDDPDVPSTTTLSRN